MLVELSVMEQRYQAVLAITQDGWKVTEVDDRRMGPVRQFLLLAIRILSRYFSRDNWLSGYHRAGLAALADKSHRTHTCLHQISPELLAQICAMRRLHAGSRAETWENRRSLLLSIAEPNGALPSLRLQGGGRRLEDRVLVST